MLLQKLRVSLVGAILLICFSAASVAFLQGAEGEMRTWTDAKGKFKIKAKLLSVADGVATLEKEDGSELEIELKKLSAADQKYAAEAPKDDSDNPFKSKDENPFEAKSKGNKTKSAGGKKGGSSGKSAEPRVVKVKLTAARLVKLAAPPGAWKVDVKPTEDPAFEPRSASLPSKTNFFEKLKGIAVNPRARKAAVGFVLGDPKPAGTTRLVLCDLATGECSDVATAAGQMGPVALHDDGERVVMRREEFGFGNQDRLEVWSVNGSEVVKTLAWIPYEDVQGAPRDVLWAEFVDADTLATSSRGGRIVLWKFPEIKPLYVLNVGVDGMSPALSSDRRLIAYCNGREVGLFDARKKLVIAQEPVTESLLYPNLAFSPSGKQLACISQDKLVVWDVASGKLERTIPAAGLQIHGSIAFPADGFVLANNRYLIDVENQLKLWTYDGAEEVRAFAGWTLFGITDGDKNPGALVAEQVPQPAATDLLKKALTDPSLFVLKAGTTVKINVAGIRDVSQQARLQEALAKRLQTIDCQAGPAGTIELVATVDGPKERTVSYFGSGDFKVQEYFSKIQFVYHGTPAWETGTTNVPGVITLKQGENVGSVLKAREKPDYDFFDRVELPRFLQKPVAGKGPTNGSLTLGQSRVTTSGMQ